MANKSYKPSPFTSNPSKPTREEASVESFSERDRIGIWIEDRRTNKTIVEWWDDDARQMFEDGFFKPGIPQMSWEKPSTQFINSVLDYAEEMGFLAKEKDVTAINQAIEGLRKEGVPDSVIKEIEEWRDSLSS